MSASTDISALLLDLSKRDRALLAVELIDSLGDPSWDDDELSRLAEERDAEVESGAVSALTYDEFFAGVRRPVMPK